MKKNFVDLTSKPDVDEDDSVLPQKRDSPVPDYFKRRVEQKVTGTAAQNLFPNTQSGEDTLDFVSETFSQQSLGEVASKPLFDSDESNSGNMYIEYDHFMTFENNAALTANTIEELMTQAFVHGTIDKNMFFNNVKVSCVYVRSENVLSAMGIPVCMFGRSNEPNTMMHYYAYYKQDALKTYVKAIRNMLGVSFEKPFMDTEFVFKGVRYNGLMSWRPYILDDNCTKTRMRIDFFAV